MTEGDARSRSRVRNAGFRILLAVSLAANLLIVGIVAGFLWRGGPHRHGAEDRLMPMIMALPAEERRALRDSFEHELADGRLVESGRKAGRLPELLAILRRSPFDREALRVHLARRISRHESHLRIGRDILIDRISGMSDAERLAYADRLERRVRHRRKE